MSARGEEDCLGANHQYVGTSNPDVLTLWNHRSRQSRRRRAFCNRAFCNMVRETYLHRSAKRIGAVFSRSSAAEGAYLPMSAPRFRFPVFEPKLFLTLLHV